MLFCPCDSVYNCGKSSRVYILLSTALAKQECLCFHTRFTTVFSSSVKNNVIQILMRIAQKLQIPFGYMAIFTYSVAHEFGGVFLSFSAFFKLFSSASYL